MKRIFSTFAIKSSFVRGIGLSLCLVLGSANLVHADSVTGADVGLKSVPSGANGKTATGAILNRKIVIDTDYMKGLPLGVPAGQLIVGNPSIADVVVRDEKYVFISGKSSGRTNFLVYDRAGQLAEQYVIYVRNANQYVTLMKGADDRSHYDCLPRCERVFRIEDSGNQAGDQSGKIGTALSLIDGRADRAKAEEAIDSRASSGQ